MKKCNHSMADKVKPGSCVEKVLQCPKCKKIIIKGKETPNRAFGQPKWRRYL